MNEFLVLKHLKGIVTSVLFVIAATDLPATFTERWHSPYFRVAIALTVWFFMVRYAMDRKERTTWAKFSGRVGRLQSTISHIPVSSARRLAKWLWRQDAK